MKVIVVSPYSDNLVGGIISWTKHIINYYREHHDDVDLCLVNYEKAKQVLDSGGILKRIKNGINNNLPVYKEFRTKVNEDHFNVAHICSSASFGLIRDLLIVREAKSRGIKTTVHMHFGRIPQILKSKGWERFLFVTLLKRIDCVVVMDGASMNALQDAGYNNVCLLPNPLSIDVQQLIEKQGVLKREPRKIVFAGHVGEAKGVFELVEACSDIKNIKLELLGKITVDGIRDKLMTLGGDDSKQWLSIPGNKPFEEVIREMMTCSIFVLPSHTEGFPYVILESMACSCPIVATAVGAIPEMLNVGDEKPCGVCVPVKDVEALKQAIIDLLNDNDKSQRLGNNAQKRVNERYVMPIVWKQLLEIWHSL